MVRGPGTSAPRSPLSLAAGQRGEARRPSSERRGRPRMHIDQLTVVWLIRSRRMEERSPRRQPPRPAATETQCAAPGPDHRARPRRPASPRPRRRAALARAVRSPSPAPSGRHRRRVRSTDGPVLSPHGPGRPPRYASPLLLRGLCASNSCLLHDPGVLQAARLARSGRRAEPLANIWGRLSSHGGPEPGGGREPGGGPGAPGRTRSQGRTSSHGGREPGRTRSPGRTPRRRRCRNDRVAGARRAMQIASDASDASISRRWPPRVPETGRGSAGRTHRGTCRYRGRGRRPRRGP